MIDLRVFDIFERLWIGAEARAWRHSQNSDHYHQAGALISESGFPLDQVEPQGHAVSLVLNASFPGLSSDTSGLHSLIEIISL
jgi:hypothetical protein